MSVELLDVLRSNYWLSLSQLLRLLRRINSKLVDELEMFISTYGGASESCLFFLPEFNPSVSLCDVLRVNPDERLVEVAFNLRSRNYNLLADELSLLLETYPGLGIARQLLPLSYVDF